MNILLYILNLKYLCNICLPIDYILFVNKPNKKKFIRNFEKYHFWIKYFENYHLIKELQSRLFLVTNLIKLLNFFYKRGRQENDQIVTWYYKVAWFIIVTLNYKFRFQKWDWTDLKITIWTNLDLKSCMKSSQITIVCIFLSGKKIIIRKVDSWAFQTFQAKKGSL